MVQRKEGSNTWTDNEVELLLSIKLGYKDKTESKKMPSDIFRPQRSGRADASLSGVKSPDGRVQTSAMSFLSAIYSLLLQEIKSHKQTSHTKEDVKQKGLTKKKKPTEFPVSTVKEKQFF